MKTLYTAVVTAQGGRDGSVRSSDGALDAALSVPEGLGGSGGTGTNPEQLFAGGYAACFAGAVGFVARRARKTLQDLRITAHVTISATDAGPYILSVELHGQVEGLSSEETLALMQEAHQVCPYSHATRGNIEVQLFAD